MGKIGLRCATVSMVEHTAVNRGVVGSSPERGTIDRMAAKIKWKGVPVLDFQRGRSFG